MKQELKLISMSEIQTEEVTWLWYPYIPLGKLTIVQGDPGEGKTSFVLAVISALTRGDPLPECEAAAEPMNVIYQTAEDGLADTIKPRLEMVGADCSRVLVIDDSRRELTLCDDRLECAIRETGARLIVLDPLQAYLGSDVDMHRANEVRPVLKRVSAMAERTKCAVILIGHMNKAQGLKSGYRGLGSIDFRAAARSVLLVGRLKDSPNIRVVAQDKNSLAPEGRSIAFELDTKLGFQWKGYCDSTVEDVLNGSGKVQTKTMLMEDELKRMLDRSVAAEEVLKRAESMGVSERTLMIAKKNLGIISEKQGGQWYWRLPDQGCKRLRTLHPCSLPLCPNAGRFPPVSQFVGRFRVRRVNSRGRNERRLRPPEAGNTSQGIRRGPRSRRKPTYGWGKQSACPTLSVGHNLRAKPAPLFTKEGNL